MSFALHVKTTKPHGTFASSPARQGRIEEGLLLAKAKIKSHPLLASPCFAGGGIKRI